MFAFSISINIFLRALTFSLLLLHCSNLEISLVADCNVNCGCTTASYQPVCDETNYIIYISACLAGCNDTINDVRILTWMD